jgi:transcriptional regulator with XRE-family HTH domain
VFQFRARISGYYVSLLELGQKSPTVDMLESICKPLGIRPSALLARHERKKKRR